jgi:hypothetical protein
MALPLLSQLDPLGVTEGLKSFLSKVRESLDAIPRPVWPGIQWPPL